MSLKVSIYITSYNQKYYLIEAIESVLNQTLKPYQIIIVDDCSTDGSQNIIAAYVCRYPELITPIYHSQNQGVAQTRIHAMQAVTGDYATYVDGDDRILPTKLEKEAKLLQENPDAQIAFSNYYYITENGIRTGLWADGEIPPQGDVFRQTFTRDFPRGGLFRHELVNYKAWKEIGFYDPNINLYEDYEMRLRLTKHLRVVYYNEPLAEYRRVKGGLSSTQAAKYFSTSEYIYNSNIYLLNDLKPEERKKIKLQLRETLAKLAIWAIQEELEYTHYSINSHLAAWKHYLRMLKYKPNQPNFKLLLKLVFPVMKKIKRV